MAESSKKSLSYRDAGLDLDVYDQTMAALPPLLRRTHSPRVIDGFGGFAALFSLDLNHWLFSRSYRRPVLVACTDGVGSKLKVASLAKKHNTVGIDLVAMSVNDAICTGGEPLLFLDYIAMPKDDPILTKDIVQGISDGCLLADCSLVGGETAILPDVYAQGDYDLAGFCVGVVERDRIIDGKSIQVGDAVIGLSSSGLHSNGYSLVRKIVFESAKLSVADHVPELGRTVGEELLEPTRIYVKPLKDVLRHYPVKKGVVRGLAHITGGGLVDNLPRVLPPGRRAFLKRGSWTAPPVFSWLRQLGNIEQSEMDRVFNCGIGFAMVVGKYFAESIRKQLSDDGVPSYLIGEIREGETGVEWE